MSVVAIGLNHRTVPLDLLGRMTIDAEGLPKALDDLVGRENVSEAVVLSTCNRTEVYVVAERFHGAYHDVRDFLSEHSHLAPEDFSHHLYVHYDSEAIRHLFSVAAGLDSAVVGEHEILGQVRSAWAAARATGSTGASLDHAFRHALEAGKRARTETDIARHTASVSQAAVDMAADHLAGLAGRRVLVLGAGEMGRGLGTSLTNADLADLAILNRTWSRSQELAQCVGGRAVRLSDLTVELETADLLLTSTGASTLLLDHTDLEPVVATRAGRPLLIIDIAVPRDVDRGVGDLEGVTLLDMDDLVAYTEAGLRERVGEVGAVRAIVDEELQRHEDASLAREVAPIVAGLHQRGVEVRQNELARFAGRLATLDQAQREAVEGLVAGVVGKLLHEPTVQLKGAAGTPRGERLAESLRDLFRLG